MYNTWFNLQMLQDPILRQAREWRRPVSFSVVPEVATMDRKKKKRTKPGIHTVGTPRQKRRAP